MTTEEGLLADDRLRRGLGSPATLAAAPVTVAMLVLTIFEDREDNILNEVRMDLANPVSILGKIILQKEIMKE